jgi:hypothetical protein
MAINTTTLLAGVKRRISMPASQVLLEDDDILAFADDVIRSKIIPVLEGVNQEYFVTSTDVTIVASQSEYAIPYRAIGRALRELKLKDSTDATNVRNIAKVNIEDIQMFLSGTLVTGFYFKGDLIRLIPDVPSTYAGTDVLEVWYRLPPNKLVATSEVATVVSATTTVVTVDAVPSGITALTPIDFIQGQSGNRIYSIDKTPTAVGSTTISFTSGDIPTGLTAGDLVCLAGYSSVLNGIPDEAYPYLESCVAKRCLKAIGDFEGSRELDEDISEEKKALLSIIEPRMDGEPTIIINRYGLVRGQRFGQGRWLYGQ